MMTEFRQIWDHHVSVTGLVMGIMQEYMQYMLVLEGSSFDYLQHCHTHWGQMYDNGSYVVSMSSDRSCIWGMI